MMKLDNFVGMMTGHFDNKDQFNKMQAEGKTYPYAEHVNTICNDKINNLPEDFKGKFVVEESYYEIPKGEDKNTFSYDSMKNVDYSKLEKFEKFTPALCHGKDGIWEGGSTSQFSPVMTFKLWEKFSNNL